MRLGKKPGAAIKEAIEHQIARAGDNPEPKTYHQTQEAPVDEPKVRFEILLTESEKRAIRERAKNERCSMRRWIIDACRAGLTREPQFGMREIDALGESNYQLVAIGRNLNQIARRLNEGKNAKVTVEQIEKLTAIIGKHTDVVCTAMRANLERWSVE
ncbi:MobC family plasmid mobilization relaxosome protein [Burkholderia multivorans]|uniref:plasmid mobilization relaxosome protein MobC n=1 Tax=Burkholderia multivorans TaxID=87883 RepID=UPI002015F78C|nr:plasmid mobilization relaxosome protein MobC [Burkholderia multivorans]MCA8504785.1 MobC family plasmid mobilization relaxosome protein [Burkholderia multivorans]MDN8083622.1 plasmid mobilization relaxosome protein MobC [Burkholderia multivorans]